MDQVESAPEIAAEQTVESETIAPVEPRVRRSSRSTRHILGPGSRVRIVKGGMIITKNKKRQSEEQESLENIELNSDLMKDVIIKQEVVDQSPLHELAEISMQHAQNLFKCEMCSEVFSDRAQLLVHVPIHI